RRTWSRSSARSERSPSHALHPMSTAGSPAFAVFGGVSYDAQMSNTVYRTCPLCEATCGIAITVDGDRVVSVRGDDADPFSRGYVCPKAAALADLHHDPDRLQRPVVREGSSWRTVEWDVALDLVARRLREVRERHGKDAVAVYQGNPTAHNLGL